MLARWIAVTSVAVVSCLSGCSSPVPCAAGCGVGGDDSTSVATTGPGCTESTGVLHGTVFQFMPPNSEPAANALVQLRQDPSDTPLNAMADAQGNYSVPLPAGTWIVGGESADGYCTALTPETVSIAPCGDVEHDVVLDDCVL